MADRVDAPVELMQPSGAQSLLDRLSSHPQGKQLPPCHHPMLAIGELSDPGIGSTRLLPGFHRTPKSRLVKVRPARGTGSARFTGCA